MNYLLICPKADTKLYTSAIKNVHNSSVLGAVNSITEDKTIKIIKEKYNPHSIFIVDNFIFKDNQNYRTIDLIKDIRKNCSSAKIYYLNVGCNEDIKQQLNDLLIYNILTRAVTDREFSTFIQNGFKTIKDEEEFNAKIVSSAYTDVKVKKSKQAIKINPLYISIGIGAFVIIGLLILGIMNGDNTSSEDTQTSATTIKAEETTTVEKTEPIESETLSVTAVVETTTAKATEKETKETKPLETTTTKNTSGGSSSGSSGGNTNTTEKQTDPPTTVKPTENKTNPPATQNTKTTITPTIADIKVGDTLDIKVSGINTSKGINWSIDNKAVISFVSADITKVTVKANAEGVALVTGVLKANGETIQCLVTVKE